MDIIHKRYFLGFNSLTGIEKHALKKVLVDLYVAWLNDPEMCIGFYMGSGYYKSPFHAQNNGPVLGGKDRVNSRTNLAPLNYKYGYPFLRGFIYQFTCVLIGIGNTCFKVLKKLSDVIDLCGLGWITPCATPIAGV